jgi:hypothetical protein
MPLYTITPTDIESYFVNFATKLFHAPGAPHLGELAATSKAIPAPLLVDLTAKLAQLDPRVVGSTMAARVREVAAAVGCDIWAQGTRTRKQSLLQL